MYVDIYTHTQIYMNICIFVFFHLRYTPHAYLRGR